MIRYAGMTVQGLALDGVEVRSAPKVRGEREIGGYTARPNHALFAGDKLPLHKHDKGHLAFVFEGAYLVRVIPPDAPESLVILERGAKPLWIPGEYTHDFIALTPDAAMHCIAFGSLSEVRP